MEGSSAISIYLTLRERDILSFLASGKTSKEIAVALRISTATVGTHRKHICGKLGVHSTAELVAEAARHSKALTEHPK